MVSTSLVMVLTSLVRVLTSWDYSQYVKAYIKPNMIVRCIQMSVWHGPDDPGPIRSVGIEDGTLGRVVSTNEEAVTVIWQGLRKCVGAMLTPPCNILA